MRAGNPQEVRERGYREQRTGKGEDLTRGHGRDTLECGGGVVAGERRTACQRLLDEHPLPIAPHHREGDADASEAILLLLCGLVQEGALLNIQADAEPVPALC